MTETIEVETASEVAETEPGTPTTGEEMPDEPDGNVLKPRDAAASYITRGF